MGKDRKVLTNDSFQSFVVFPTVKARKEFGDYEAWIIEIAILRDLYFYSYRFFLPPYFLIYQKDFELQVKLHFIQVYASQNLKKIFSVNKIMQYYQNSNNYKKAQIKDLIKDSIQQALTHKMIQNYCEVEFRIPKSSIPKSKVIKINQLNRLVIGQSHAINFMNYQFSYL